MYKTLARMINYESNEEKQWQFSNWNDEMHIARLWKLPLSKIGREWRNGQMRLKQTRNNNNKRKKRKNTRTRRLSAKCPVACINNARCALMVIQIPLCIFIFYLFYKHQFCVGCRSRSSESSSSAAAAGRSVGRRVDCTIAIPFDIYTQATAFIYIPASIQ